MPSCGKCNGSSLYDSGDPVGQQGDPAFNWLGLISRKPITEDYVPLLPWLGLMWWGLASGRWLLKHRPVWLQRSVSRPLRPLAVLGRWSLSYYLLHQPVLMGFLLLVGLLR